VPNPINDDELDRRINALVDALPPLTDEECKAIGDLLVQVRVGVASQ